jgi:hypothetical protein
MYYYYYYVMFGMPPVTAVKIPLFFIRGTSSYRILLIYVRLHFGHVLGLKLSATALRICHAFSESSKYFQPMH